MKTSIAKCFKEQGLFGEMLDPATLSRVNLEQFQLNLVPDELEVNDDFIDDLIGPSDDVTDDLVRELLEVGLEEDESSDDEESSNDE